MKGGTGVFHSGFRWFAKASDCTCPCRVLSVSPSESHSLPMLFNSIFCCFAPATVVVVQEMARDPSCCCLAALAFPTPLFTPMFTYSPLCRVNEAVLAQEMAQDPSCCLAALAFPAPTPSPAAGRALAARAAPASAYGVNTRPYSYSYSRLQLLRVYLNVDGSGS